MKPFTVVLSILLSTAFPVWQEETLPSPSPPLPASTPDMAETAAPSTAALSSEESYIVPENEVVVESAMPEENVEPATSSPEVQEETVEKQDNSDNSQLAQSVPAGVTDLQETIDEASDRLSRTPSALNQASGEGSTVSHRLQSHGKIGRYDSFITEGAYEYISFLTLDNRAAYCLEPDVSLMLDGQNGAAYEPYEWEGLSDEKRALCRRIAFYGYGNPLTGNSMEAYTAAQLLIWREVCPQLYEKIMSNYVQTDSSGKVTSTDAGNLKERMRRIMNLVENFNACPSFANEWGGLERYGIGWDETLDLEDTNNVLSWFSVNPDEEHEGISIKIENNHLYADIDDLWYAGHDSPGSAALTFRRKDTDWDRANSGAVVYASGNSQKLFAESGDDPSPFYRISLYLKSSSLIIHKKDEYGNELDAQTEFALFWKQDPEKQYRSNGGNDLRWAHLQKTASSDSSAAEDSRLQYPVAAEKGNDVLKLSCDERGMLQITEFLPCDTDFYIQEISTSPQYECDEKPYLIHTPKQGECTEYDFVNHLQTDRLVIEKTDSENGKLLSGAEFDIYQIEDFDPYEKLHPSGIQKHTSSVLMKTVSSWYSRYQMPEELKTGIEFTIQQPLSQDKVKQHHCRISYVSPEEQKVSFTDDSNQEHTVFLDNPAPCAADLIGKDGDIDLTFPWIAEGTTVLKHAALHLEGEGMVVKAAVEDEQYLVQMPAWIIWNDLPKTAVSASVYTIDHIVPAVYEIRDETGRVWQVSKEKTISPQNLEGIGSLLSYQDLVQACTDAGILNPEEIPAGFSFVRNTLVHQQISYEGVQYEDLERDGYCNGEIPRVISGYQRDMEVESSDDNSITLRYYEQGEVRVTLKKGEKTETAELTAVRPVAYQANVLSCRQFDLSCDSALIASGSDIRVHADPSHESFEGLYEAVISKEKENGEILKEGDKIQLSASHPLSAGDGFMNNERSCALESLWSKEARLLVSEKSSPIPSQVVLEGIGHGIRFSFDNRIYERVENTSTVVRVKDIRTEQTYSFFWLTVRQEAEPSVQETSEDMKAEEEAAADVEMMLILPCEKEIDLRERFQEASSYEVKENDPNISIKGSIIQSFLPSAVTLVLKNEAGESIEERRILFEKDAQERICRGIRIAHGTSGKQYLRLYDPDRHNRTIIQDTLLVYQRADGSDVPVRLKAENGMFCLSDLEAGTYYYRDPAGGEMKSVEVKPEQEVEGKLFLDGFQEGMNYLAVETKSPEGYESSVSCGHEIKMHDQSGEHVVEHVIENNLRRMKISVQKVDQDDESTPLNGAWFTVEDITNVSSDGQRADIVLNDLPADAAAGDEVVIWRSAANAKRILYTITGADEKNVYLIRKDSNTACTVPVSGYDASSCMLYKDIADNAEGIREGISFTAFEKAPAKEIRVYRIVSLQRAQGRDLFGNAISVKTISTASLEDLSNPAKIITIDRSNTMMDADAVDLGSYVSGGILVRKNREESALPISWNRMISQVPLSRIKEGTILSSDNHTRLIVKNKLRNGGRVCGVIVSDGNDNEWMIAEGAESGRVKVPMQGIEVKLFKENGELLAAKQTDSNGICLFADLAEDDYIVETEGTRTKTHVSPGSLNIPDVPYGHSIRICETKSPLGHVIGNACFVMIPKTSRQQDTIVNRRSNPKVTTVQKTIRRRVLRRKMGEEQ